MEPTTHCSSRWMITLRRCTLIINSTIWCIPIIVYSNINNHGFLPIYLTIRPYYLSATSSYRLLPCYPDLQPFTINSSFLKPCPHKKKSLLSCSVSRQLSAECSKATPRIDFLVAFFLQPFLITVPSNFINFIIQPDSFPQCLIWVVINLNSMKEAWWPVNEKGVVKLTCDTFSK